MSDDLACRVSTAVVDSFNNLKVKSGKPVTRSNGVKEWTVLAGIVAILPNEEVLPITVSTGVKALPERVREYSGGLFVSDLHAEILAFRLFNWYLLDECSALKDSREKSQEPTRSTSSDSHINDTEGFQTYDSKIIEKDVTSGQFKIRDGVKLALYISEAPCGDASMSKVSSEDSEPWRKRPKLDPKLKELSEVIRGRGHFDKLGIVRTKPGRNDSLITLSKSCSDKICVKQILGITNPWTSLLFPGGVYLDYLVLQEDKINVSDFKRCFEERIPQNPEFKVKTLQLLTYAKDDYQFHKPTTADTTATPSQLSLLYIVPTKTIQVLNNGVKNGSFIKNKPPKKGGESFICNRQFYLKGKELVHFEAGRYREFKRSNITRELLKSKVRGILDSWVATGVDDFQFDEATK